MKKKNTSDRTGEKAKGRKGVTALLLVLCAALFLGGLFLILREHVLLPDASYVPPATPAPATPMPTLTPTPIPDASQTPVITPSPTPYVKPLPVKILFVEQKQSCEVIADGVDEDNRMIVVNRPDAASWLETGPAPGEEGNAIIAGHRSLKGVAGTFRALWDMEVGDAVVVEFEDGSQQWFYAGHIARYPFKEVPPEVMSFGGPDRLTLITCIGDWNSGANTSSERFVVTCFPGVYETP